MTQAALHTTTMSSFQIVLDLAARPAYIHMLRAEIEAVIQTDGYETDEEGYLKLKKPSMTKLRKLDSFMKESQRIHFMGHGKYFHQTLMLTMINMLYSSIKSATHNSTLEAFNRPYTSHRHSLLLPFSRSSHIPANTLLPVLE